jgi:hypothetical protein
MLNFYKFFRTEQIKPAGKTEDGLLCGECIMGRIEKISDYDYWYLRKNELDRFFEGQIVQALFFNDDSRLIVGENGVTKITVVMEGVVPWFAVFDDHRIVSKWNSAYVAGVNL